MMNEHFRNPNDQLCVADFPSYRHCDAGPFVVSVVSSWGVLISTYAPIVLLFAIPLIAVQTDEIWYRFPLGPDGVGPGPWERNFISLVLLTLLGLTLSEMLLNILRLAFDRVAIVITSEGVRGWHAWLRRSFRWDEISHVRQSGNRLIIHRRAKSKFMQCWNNHSQPGGRYHWSQMLVVELNYIDRSPDMVLAEINRHWQAGKGPMQMEDLGHEKAGSLCQLKDRFS
jgi:hypothetical protein